MPDRNSAVGHPAFLIVVVAVILIVVGRVSTRLPVAIAGYVLLAAAAVFALATQ